MAVVSLDEVKEQLRLDHDEDDALLTKKIAAAQNHIERLLGFSLDEITYPDTDDDDFPATVPPALRECVCQLAAHWYENRETVVLDVSAQTLPIGFYDVIQEFRNWSWAEV